MSLCAARFVYKMQNGSQPGMDSLCLYILLDEAGLSYEQRKHLLRLPAGRPIFTLKTVLGV